MYHKIKNPFLRACILAILAVLTVYAVYVAVEDTGLLRPRYVQRSAETSKSVE